MAKLVSAPKSSDCVSTSFTGNVKRGLPFVQTIGSGLSYQIVPVEHEVSDPNHPPKFVGWEIRIAYLKNRGEMEREFSEVMTPLENGVSPRNINTRNGRTVNETLKANHDVFFPTTIEDNALVRDLTDDFFEADSSLDRKEDLRELYRIPTGSAEFEIVDQQLEGDPKTPTGILALSFKIELTVPSIIKLPPDLASRAQAARCRLAPSNSIVPRSNKPTS